MNEILVKAENAGYNEAEEIEIILGDTCKIVYADGISGIQKNDILTFTRDYFGTVRSVQVLYRLGTSRTNSEAMKSYKLTNKSYLIFGEAIRLYKSTGLDLKNRTGLTELYSISKNVNVYIFKGGKIEPSDLGELMDTKYQETGDFVLAHRYDDEFTEILIIKE